MKSLRYFKITLLPSDMLTPVKCLYMKALTQKEAKEFVDYLWKVPINRLHCNNYGVNKTVDPDLKSIFGDYPGKCYINTKAAGYRHLNIVQLVTYEVVGAFTREEKLNQLLTDAV